jgi:hypothetical protein
MPGEPINTVDNNPLDAGIGMGADSSAPVAPSKHSQSRRASVIIRNNLILACLFAAGLLGVYLLSLRGGPTQASAEQLQAEQQVDAALLAKSPSIKDSRSAKTIVDSFYEEARLRQIPIGSLKTNPFLQRVRLAAAIAPAATNPAESAIATVASMDQTAATDAVKQLKLQTILSGADGRALAMISNNLISEGQTISGWTVIKINPKDVTLSWKDQKYTLQLGD